MNVKKAILILIGIFCTHFSVTFAKDALSFYLENDSRFTKPNGNTDRHYTNGAKIVYTTQPDWSWLKDFSTWHFADEGEPVDTAVGFFVGQNIYTPDRTDEPERRDPEDRVYAGWLYGGMFAQRATADTLDHVEVNAGVIGPSSHAQQVQDCIHNFIHSNKAEGWDNQLEDEFAADAVFMRQQRITDGILAPSEHSDFIGEYGFTAGSVHRNAELGMIWRYGYNLAGTFGPDRLSLPAGISALRRQQDYAYAFIRASGKAVEHDRFLTGLDEEPFVGSLQAGLVYKKGRYEFGYSQTFLTREFEGQHGKDSYGAFTLSILF